MSQQFLFDTNDFAKVSLHTGVDSRSGCFVDNMKLPIHRWYRYSAGFSSDWVRCLLQERKKTMGEGFVVLDPFAGIATTLVACNMENVSSFGFESHPFVFRMAETKLDICKCPKLYLKEIFAEFIEKLKKHHGPDIETTSVLLNKCYTKESLQELFAMKALLETGYDDSVEKDIIWFAITAILRSCSCVGTAQWQYVLPNRKKASVSRPLTALIDKTNQLIEDIDVLDGESQCQSKLIYADARYSNDLSEDSIDLVITSPPYPNNYDYADATRLEMTFWGEIQGWADLHSTVRTHLLCSCSQHSAAAKVPLEAIINETILMPIRRELQQVCESLDQIRNQKGGKKTYHTMVASYFRDLALVFRMLRRVCKHNAELCFVIGDSAPYGVYVPVENWLGELAIAEGFHSYDFEKIRDRNVKWKNRKHDVPLKEGRLWIRG